MVGMTSVPTEFVFFVGGYVDILEVSVGLFTIAGSPVSGVLGSGVGVSHGDKRHYTLQRNTFIMTSAQCKIFRIILRIQKVKANILSLQLYIIDLRFFSTDFTGEKLYFLNTVYRENTGIPESINIFDSGTFGRSHNYRLVSSISD